MAIRRIPSSADYPLIELISPSGLRIQLTPDGRVVAFRCGDILINQVIPTPCESAMTRLYLRELGSREKQGAGSVMTESPLPASCFPLLGGGTTAPVFRKVTDRSVHWSVGVSPFEVDVTLHLHPEAAAWIWRATVRNGGLERRTVDLLYGQDLGLAHESFVRMNEAYCSQYLDHRNVEDFTFGPVILTRQNQAQNARFPWIAQGCLQGAAAWSTDGYQFFGADHRLTGRPAALALDRLPSINRQYEFAYPALQTHPFDLAPGAEASVEFFAVYLPDHPEASGEDDLGYLRDESGTGFGLDPPAENVTAGDPAPMGPSSLFDASWYHGEELSETDCASFFPGGLLHVERDESGGLLSFFTDDGRHIVARRKESIVERPHAHILRTGDSLWLDDILGTTVSMAGIFNAQVFLGNTNLARFLSVIRNPLGVMRASGQRIFVDSGDGWRQLGVPSAFEMGPYHARWLYRAGGETLEVTTRAAVDASRIDLEIRVLDGAPRAFLVSHQVAMGDNEMAQPYEMIVNDDAGRIECRPDPGSLLGGKWPNLRFTIAADPASVARLGGDELLFSDERSHDGPYAVFSTNETLSFSLTLEGSNSPVLRRDGNAAIHRGFPVHLRHTDESVARVSSILPWYAHDAWIHFTTPHGLEQYGGAAWGTRDVCQGPVEWMIAARRYDVVRRILLKMFEQQYEADGSWPQWFMFDPFRFIQSVHSHGDIVFWPLKALCDYVEASGDTAILQEAVPYTDPAGFVSTPGRVPIAAHVDKVLDQYDSRCFPGTALVNYGDGDWDDTLQPADPALRSEMVSAWTVGLAYDAFRRYRRVCEAAGLAETAGRLSGMLERIRADFHRWMMPDGVTAGFVVFEEGGPRPLLHPLDEVTGIRYRLLPMTRGILSELFTADEAREHLDLIREHLLFPDGVRLMSDPIPYRGGVARWFKRAETAANFGREIGLMYSHAHLRYAEALAKLGDGDGLWRALQVVNPVGLSAAVPHAGPRQANVYFTSSDGAFDDRYEAGKRFGELRDGRVPVKGGWRLYSSGPGLYLHKVVTRLLGLRDSFGDVVIDPVLPASLDGLVAETERDGHLLEIRYYVHDRGFAPSRIALNGRDLRVDHRDENPYRVGGVRIPTEVFRNGLHEGINRMEIEV